MTRDPRRLFEEGTRAERELLDSAREDGPSADAERRAKIALGLAVPLMPVPGPEIAAPAAAPAAAASGFSVVKIASLTAAIAGAGTASWLALSDPAQPQRIEPPAPVQRTVPLPVPPPLPVSPDPIPDPIPDRSGSRSRARTPETPAQPTLQRELELLRTARAHLDTGRFEEAEASLERYRREIGEGALREEAAALTIEAAFALERSDARALAEAFLADFPESPHAARARGLLGGP